MKNILFITLLFITSFVVNAQDSTIINNITEPERIVDKYVNKVTTAVTNIVAELEEPAKEVFDTVVRLQIAKGIVGLLPVILFFLFVFTMYKFNNLVTSWDDPSFPAIMVIIFTIAAFVVLVMAFMKTGDAIMHLIAPKWYAILELIDLVK